MYAMLLVGTLAHTQMPVGISAEPEALPRDRFGEIPDQVDTAIYRCGFEVIPSQAGFAPLLQQRQDFHREVNETAEMVR